MNLQLWQEFLDDHREIDVTNLEMQDDLAPEIWQNKLMDPEVREKLLEISNKFFDDLGLSDLFNKEVILDDILLTGSLASYNWSSFSDVDLHILLDFEKIHENTELLQDLFKEKIINWNKKHNILIHGYEVEIYIQDSKEPHISMGVYSVLNNQWVAEPLHNEPEINYMDVKKKASKLMSLIDGVEKLFNHQKYDDSHDFSKKIKEKIRKFRRCGLQKGGIFSEENLAFKVLRRNGYLQRLSDLFTDSYDAMMSLKEEFSKNWRKFVENNKKTQEKADFSLEEAGKYQELVKKDHEEAKKQTISLGKQGNKAPFSKKPPFKRSKSAPPAE
tara:strand:- start:1933 stop:2922 length:990 start_codon:yes stop_codon:yes gene_type:complete